MEKGFTITYEYGDNLYVNPTNRCDFNCTFCLRHNQSSGGSIYTHNLWLEREPTREELLASIESRDLFRYKQLVFVGFGEPTYRFDDICWVIDRMKEHGTKIYTRMDTNGTGCLINGRDICPDFEGRFDMVSVSLNTDSEEEYNAVCHPRFAGAYQAMKDFAREVPQIRAHGDDDRGGHHHHPGADRALPEDLRGGDRRRLPGAGVHRRLTRRAARGKVFLDIFRDSDIIVELAVCG